MNGYISVSYAPDPDKHWQRLTMTNLPIITDNLWRNGGMFPYEDKHQLLPTNPHEIHQLIVLQ